MSQQYSEARAELGIIPSFPPVIDSSMLSDFRACPWKGYLTYIEHWKPNFESVHLVAGGAFAKGIEIARKCFYEQGMNQPDSEARGLQALITDYGDFECPSDSAKDLDRMCGALEFYLASYPLGQDGAEPITLPSGRRGIEFSFAEPLDRLHPSSGNPLLFSGRADMVAEFAGAVFNFDEKTTTQLGQKWGAQWDLRSQFTSYCWAGRRIGVPMQGTIVRGISILKSKYDTQQAITYRSDWELDRWEEMLYRDIDRMLGMFAEQMEEPRKSLDGACTRSGNPWDRNFEPACNDYGGCPFRGVCKSKNPYEVLQADFQRRVWDPCLHKEVSVQEWESGWK
jgi:hypothetical protein